MFLLGALNFNYNLYNTPDIVNVPVLGKVINNPEIINNFTKIKIKTENGNALLYTEKYADYKYGDVLFVDGKFDIPKDEGYLNYLKKDKIYYTSFYPEIKKIEKSGGLFYKTIYLWRDKMRENIQKKLPPPHSFLAKAMILGDRSSFSEDFNEKLSVSGTRHITAISGMHIIIVSTALFLFFSFLKIKKKWSAGLSLIFIVLFIIFVGAPSSAVRAGIMGAVVLLTHFTYRKTQSLRIVFFSGGVMLAFNPLLLHYDLGFQLSFLAVIGILTFRPFIKKKIVNVDKKYKGRYKNKMFIKERVKYFLMKNEKIADLMAITISAQILVTPLILYNFGHVSLLSIPANILIVPLLQYIMPFIFLTAITGFFFFSIIAYFLLSFVVLVINFFAKLPFSAIYIETVPVYIIALLYFYIFYKARNLVYI